MIWHDDPRVQFIVPDAGAMLNGSRHLAGNRCLSEECGAAPNLVEKAIHGGERLAGSGGLAREDAVRWKAVMQAERDEQRLAYDIQMR